MIHFWDYVTITPYNLLHGPEFWLGVVTVCLATAILLGLWALFYSRKK